LVNAIERRRLGISGESGQVAERKIKSGARERIGSILVGGWVGESQILECTYSIPEAG
jgi:hypothetical protein